MIAHALTDALLGAAGLGDIGSLFPSGDERWQGADSLELLRDAYAQVREAGFALVNADCILIGEEPRIAPHREEMRRRLAAALDVEPAQVNVRATTTDRLGFTGRGEGLAARGGRAAGARVKLVRYADRPDLLEIRFERLSAVTFPEYMHHNTPGNLYWGRLYADFPDFQVALLDGDELRRRGARGAGAVGRHARGSPVRLGRGVRARDDLRPGAGARSGARDQRAARPPGRSSSRARMIQAFRDTARAAGLARVIAPVRPTWKERYPLIPIERYMSGGATTARTSTRGSGSTSAWAARSSRPRRGRW